MSLMPSEPLQRQVFSVSQLNRRVRQLLETQLPLIWVEGEISNISTPASGHWYFTLKDDGAQVRCAMFKSSNSRVSFKPESGNHVLVRCRVGLYENRGDFQLIAEHMEDAGHGALQRRFEQLRTQLSAEGLFDEQHKQPLPRLPARIGVITSPSGAAIHDILTVLKRRFPAIPVTIYPCTVQGALAGGQIVEALEQANRDKRCDVLIVARGGGSMEDLWSFNEESVARAIYHSTVPVVSAIGHEVDFTIADMAADARAATPSAAAEMLSPDINEWLAQFSAAKIQLSQTLLRKLNNHQQQLDALCRQLRHPGERIKQRNQQLAFLNARLKQVLLTRMQGNQSRLNASFSRLNRFHPQQKIAHHQQQLLGLFERSQNGIHHALQKKNVALKNTVHLLNTVNPLQTLERGYAIVQDENHQVVRQVASVTCGDKISARIADGILLCSINQIVPTNQN